MPVKTKQDWREFCDKWGMKEVERFSHDGMDILVAEGSRSALEPMSVADHLADRVDPSDMMGGYYRVVWAIAKDDKLELAGPALLFQWGHDPDIPSDMKQRARVRTAIDQAVSHIEAAKGGLKYGKHGSHRHEGVGFGG